MRVAETARRSLHDRCVYAVAGRGPAAFGLDRPWQRVGAFLAQDYRTLLALAQATADGVFDVDAFSDAIGRSSNVVD